ncbi:MAG: amidohydrolase family protein, partial [Deltaproteobacteria bacterium]|nr:amidohydrolase family protein [Deltaproteobacteria bacterium]
MKKITIEEHFTTEEHLDQLSAILDKKYPIPEVAEEEKILFYEVPFLVPTRREEAVKRLLDIGDGRIKDMDDAGIDKQVLSLVSPGVQVFDAAAGTALAKKINDQLSEAVNKYPERLAGFASLAPQDPGAAADELERTVKDFGFKGACINSHTKGEYLDEKKYWVLFERAEKLGVPIYIHPRSPSPDMVKPYLDYPMLSTAMIGFA